MVDWGFLASAIEPEWISGLLAAAIFTLGVILIHVLPRYKWLAAAILLIIITPLALPGFWFSDGHLGVSDWDLYFTYRHHLHRTITEFHQFPLWNPWMCGGSAALGDPEFPVLAPTFLTNLIFGSETGLKVTIYIATAVGAVGVLMLGKRLGLSVYGALIAALGVAFSSVNLLEIVEGHPNIFSAMWVPWIFWSWLAAYRSSRVSFWPIVCGIFLAFTFFQGGIYMLSYTTLAFLVLLLLAPNHKRAFLITLTSGLWALGFAWVKLIPTILWLRQFQDESYASSTYTIPYLHKVLFGRYLHGAGGARDIIPDQGSGWHEYGAYIGPFIGALAVIGLTKLRKTRIVPALAIATILTILLSSSGPLLKPIFDQISFIPRSNISRIILFAVIPISLLAGYGLDALRERMRHKWLPAIVAIALLAYVAGDLFTLSVQLSNQAFVLPYPEIPISPAPSPIAHLTSTYDIRHNEVDYTRAYAATIQGYGTSASCNVLRPKNVARTIHDKENFGPVLVSKNMTIHETAWAPSRVTTRITTVVDQTEVMLNTNYAKGWWVIEGETPPRPAEDVQGRVGIWASRGSHTLTFFYRPRGMYAGMAITGLTMAVALISGFARRYRGRRSLPHS